MNYFELFEIPVSLTIDKAAITKKYVALQKKYHPDFFTQENEYAQDEALEKSSAINKAMKVFKTQEAVIKYLLEIKGMVVEEEKSAKEDLVAYTMMESYTSGTKFRFYMNIDKEAYIYASATDSVYRHIGSAV